jgi:hypothetical protein
MGKPDTRRLDREIRATIRKLTAVQQRELWPLTGRERRTILTALAGGGYRLTRGRSTGRAEQRLDTAWQSAELRLNAELSALHGERQRLLTEAARTKAAKKSSGWF